MWLRADTADIRAPEEGTAGSRRAEVTLVVSLSIGSTVGDVHNLVKQVSFSISCIGIGMQNGTETNFSSRLISFCFQSPHGHLYIQSRLSTA